MLLVNGEWLMENGKRIMADTELVEVLLVNGEWLMENGKRIMADTELVEVLMVIRQNININN